ncbi:nucleotidyltransferase domain-containing protein [Chloracidobacterium validum]|uniref:Nucleotidyltransferase domain-containing protein n=1 Tax=Chloracidobacterium validum TaxID=2821543 RepID=A0ABX8BB42_9BACT|nr:nucleotidyltransferase domain-containing protein [Chloracidobacterium validum]QUW04151.1 nucleotidyltransferase domain-containing protein [Chloracidobacterium validum]
MNKNIELPKEQIADFCRRWSIVELSLFGSVLRSDFCSESDVDVLVSFAPDVLWGFSEWIQMTRELEEIFGRKVDLVERRLVEQSRNYIRRNHILNNLERVYVA